MTYHFVLLGWQKKKSSWMMLSVCRHMDTGPSDGDGLSPVHI